MLSRRASPGAERYNTSQSYKIIQTLVTKKLYFLEKKKCNSRFPQLVGAGDEPKTSAMQVAKYDHHLVVVKNLNVGSIIITKEILEDLSLVRSCLCPTGIKSNISGCLPHSIFTHAYTGC